MWQQIVSFEIQVGSSNVHTVDEIHAYKSKLVVISVVDFVKNQARYWSMKRMEKAWMLKSASSLLLNVILSN